MFVWVPRQQHAQRCLEMRERDLRHAVPERVNPVDKQRADARRRTEDRRDVEALADMIADSLGWT